MNTNLQGTQNPNFETTLHEMTVGDLTMKLTNEKLFINSLGSSETFALRSISGIGVIDLIDEYNKDLDEHHKKVTEKKFPKFLLAILGFCFLIVDFPNIGCIIFALVLFGIAFFIHKKQPEIPKPEMKSAVRLILTGNNRDFVFCKKTPNGNEVGKFIALIEDTLTSYQRI